MMLTLVTDHPGRPTNHGYTGSEEFLRLQFEEYLLALLSSAKYQLYAEKNQDDPTALLADACKLNSTSVNHDSRHPDGHPANDFGAEWVAAWMTTDNFRLFHKFTGELSKQSPRGIADVYKRRLPSFRHRRAEAPMCWRHDHRRRTATSSAVRRSFP